MYSELHDDINVFCTFLHTHLPETRSTRHLQRLLLLLSSVAVLTLSTASDRSPGPDDLSMGQ